MGESLLLSVEISLSRWTITQRQLYLLVPSAIPWRCGTCPPPTDGRMRKISSSPLALVTSLQGTLHWRVRQRRCQPQRTCSREGQAPVGSQSPWVRTPSPKTPASLPQHTVASPLCSCT